MQFVTMVITTNKPSPWLDDSVSDKYSDQITPLKQHLLVVVQILLQIILIKALQTSSLV